MEHQRWSLFAKIVNGLKTLNIFTRKVLSAVIVGRWSEGMPFITSVTQVNLGLTLPPNNSLDSQQKLENEILDSHSILVS